LWYRHTEYGTRFTIDKLYQCKHDSYENFEAFIDDLGDKSGFINNDKNFILATPEEVFNYLKPKPMEHEPMKGEELEALQMTIEKKKSEELKDELEALKIEKDKMIDKGIGLVQQRDELKKHYEEFKIMYNGLLCTNTTLESDNDILRIQVAKLKAANNGFVKENSSITLERDELNDLVDLIYNETLSIKLMNEIVSNIHNMISRFRTPSIVGTTQTVEIDGKKYEVTINKEI